MGVVGWRCKFLPVLALLGALAVLSGPRSALATPAAPRTPPPPDDGALRVAVAPFVNERALLTIDWMRVGLPAALADVLQRHPGLVVAASPEGVVPGASVPDTADGAARVAKDHGAAWVITGRFARVDWKLGLDVSLWDCRQAPCAAAATAHEVVDYGQSMAMLARTAGALVAKAGRPFPAGAAAVLGEVPTRDFYAFTLLGRARAQLHGVGRAADLPGAEKNATRAIFIDPKQGAAHRTLAIIYQRLNQPAKARGRVAYALDVNPDDPVARALAAADASVRRSSDEAIEHLARLLAVHPSDLDARTRLGELLWARGDLDGAYLELSRVVKVNPGHLAARRLIVLVHASRGDQAALATELEAVVALDPKDEDARLDLGAAYSALGRKDEARVIYEAVVADDPRAIQALKFLGDLAREARDFDRAIAWYQRARKAAPRDPRPLFLLGATYAEAGNLKAAVRSYQTALRFTDYAPDAEASLAALLYELGDPQALWYARHAARLRPRDPRVQYNLGVILGGSRRPDEALVALDRAAQLAPQDADVHFARGTVLLALGDVTGAEAAFERCLELSPEHADARHNLDLLAELKRRTAEGEMLRQ